jgi:beta-lactamase class D
LFFLENLNDGWKLYGKTGSCFKLTPNGTPNYDRQVGWFIGWLTQGSQKIVFAQYAEDKKKMDSPAGKRVKEMAREKILQMISTMKKASSTLIQSE